MPQEITIPDGYTGTISQENAIIQAINKMIMDLESRIQSLPDKVMVFDRHIADFEEYSMDIYFSENKKKANISIVEDIITVSINEVTIKIDADGNII